MPVGTPIAIIGKAGDDIAALVEEAKARAAGGAAKPAAAAKPEPPKPAAAPAPPRPAPAPAAGRRLPPTAAARAAPGSAAPRAGRAAPGGARGARCSPRRWRASWPPTSASICAPSRARAPAAASSSATSRPSPRAAAAAPAADWHAAEEAPSAHAPRAPRVSAAAPLPAQLVPERRAEARPAAAPPADDVVKPLSMMRRTIATRLLESKTTIPHFYLTADVDMDAAMEFREQVAQVHGAKLSVNDLVLKACALAMRRIPEANASFTEEAIIQHARVDIGMAVAIEDGLITPVIRDADKKTIGQIATEAREMAGRARERKLKPEEYTGATFSVSNLGMLGIRTSPPSSTRPRAPSWPSAPSARSRSSRTTRSSSASACRSRCRATTASSTARSAPSCCRPSSASSRSRSRWRFDLVEAARAWLTNTISSSSGRPRRVRRGDSRRAARLQDRLHRARARRAASA